MRFSRSILPAVLTVALSGCAAQSISVAQSAGPVTPASTESKYRIAGTIVNSLDGRPLGRARVSIGNVKRDRESQSMITLEDGRFQFTGLDAGKYSLSGAKRGFVTASYDEHEEFSTAIVTGAGLKTENLVLRLAPDAVLTGKVFDEAGDPVRRANVMIYREDHRDGVGRIQQFRNAVTDDQGSYEVTSLMPGTYFLSVTATPWYAVHPMSARAGGATSLPSLVNRSLDVTYPTVYYADATDPDSATPILLKGGEYVQIDVHVTPVPALHLLIRTADSGNGGNNEFRNGFSMPRLLQPAFDGASYVQSANVHMVSPGLVELTGIPAGKYRVRTTGANGQTNQFSEVDLTDDNQEVNAKNGEPLSTVKLVVQLANQATLPPRLLVVLRHGKRNIDSAQVVGPKGEADFRELESGKYEVVAWAEGKRYSVARMVAEGGGVLGHTLDVTAGSNVTVAIQLVEGSSDVDGFAKREGKGVAGVMVVLVPKDPENNRDLFRRDQSDQDGSFRLPRVTLGQYTVVAIENGWNLDWSQPGVIAQYVKRGQTVTVVNRAQQTIQLPDPVEVQPK